MNDPKQSLEEILFEVALQKPTAAERAAFLETVGRDNPLLRTSLEDLLKAHFGGAGFLATPPAPSIDPPPSLPTPEPSPRPAQESSARTVGRYRLLERIGEGGFGEVWMAEQREPVKRRVALKIIKLGMDSRQVVARFEAERQALAMMDHPNIARILDAGTTTAESILSPKTDPSSPFPNAPARIHEGRPYFVMELVRGIKITDYCDQAQLPTSTGIHQQWFPLFLHPGWSMARGILLGQSGHDLACAEWAGGPPAVDHASRKQLDPHPGFPNVGRARQGWSELEILGTGQRPPPIRVNPVGFPLVPGTRRTPRRATGDESWASTGIQQGRPTPARGLPRNVQALHGPHPP